MIDKGIFGHSSEVKDRLKSLDEVSAFAAACKQMGLRVVLTNGSFDLIHVGHKRYLAAARSKGDLLIVGVDSDEKIRSRKGEDRPLVPQDERLEMLAGLRSVDVVVMKELNHEKWALIKAVLPDVLVVSETTNINKSIPQAEIDALTEFCGERVILPAQAETSTSARIRNFTMNVGNRLTKAIVDAVPGIVVDALEGGKGGKA